MKKMFISILLILFVSEFVWADDVDLLCQKLPEDMLGFVATSGLDAVGDDFNKTALGQIVADPQVQSFFKQLITAISATEGFKFNGVPSDYVALVKEVLRSPTIGAMSINAESPDEPVFYLLSKTITDTEKLQSLLTAAMQPAVESGKIRKQVDSGNTLYVYNDPNQPETFYIAQVNGYVAAAANDTAHSLLNRLSKEAVNTKVSSILNGISSSQKAIVYYVDYQQLMSMMENEAVSAQETQMFKTVFSSLGLEDIRYNLAFGGFEGSNIVLQGQIVASTTGGIWDVIGQADRSLFQYADPAAMQAGVVKINPGLLYDTIFQTIQQVNAEAAQQAKTKIAETEALLDFKIREDLLENLEGSFMGYTLPAYSSPELQVGGYVLTAKVRDAEKIEQCLVYLGNVAQSMSENQMQVTTQESATGKPIHIWAVSVMAMMQIIPSWTIEGDTLIIASHPNLTRRVLEQYETAGRDSLLSNPAFSGLLYDVPYDACVIVLTDSQAQARQMMQLLQRFWPIFTMGLMGEGIQLPIILPSIDSYIEQMEPGYRYARKGADGLEWYYQGTGLEGGIGGAAGGAMGLAILMPALSRTKTVAERVVCGTNLKGLSTAMFVYCNDYEDMLPTSNWCDLLIEETDMSPKSFVCPESNAIEGESSYAMNKNIAGKNLGELPPDTVMLFETDKGVEDGSRNASIKTRRHYELVNEFNNVYDEETMVYKDRFNQLGGPEDIVLRHDSNGQEGCNIAFTDGHTEFVTKDRIADLRWAAD